MPEVEQQRGSHSMKTSEKFHPAEFKEHESTVTIEEQAGRDLSTLLASLGLECYIQAFRQENLEIENLFDLSDDHFKELGVTVGHRVKIKKAITDLKRSAALSHRKLEYVCKVIVVGDSATGKTSLIERYTKGHFDRGYKSTIGVDFCLKEMKWNRNTTVNIQLWDIAGQERFASMTRMYYKEARGAFVVFDATRDKTFEGVLKWKSDIDQKIALPNGETIPVILLANKSDLLTKNIEIDLDEFCRKYGFKKWFLTSAKENIGITEAADYLVNLMMEGDNVHIKPSVKDINKLKGLCLLPPPQAAKKSGAACNC